MQAIRNHVIICLMMLVPLIHSCAMATEKVLLWPAIEGQILNAGKPVPDLELIQTLYWNYEENTAPPRVRTVKTDEKGHFVFPKITGEISNGFLTRLFHQPGISLGIDTHFEGQEINLYAAANSTYTHKNGFNATDLMACDLSNLEKFDGRLVGNCEVKEKHQ